MRLCSTKGGHFSSPPRSMPFGGQGPDDRDLMRPSNLPLSPGGSYDVYGLRETPECVQVKNMSLLSCMAWVVLSAVQVRTPRLASARPVQRTMGRPARRSITFPKAPSGRQQRQHGGQGVHEGEPRLFLMAGNQAAAAR